MTEALRRTALYGAHEEAGAKLVPFAGFEMPLHYPAGITAEHQAVRSAAGLFDVSHMGQLELHGPRAIELAQHLTSNDVTKLEIGQVQYSTLTSEAGTLLDDLLVYREADHLRLVVNAERRATDLAWIESFAPRFEVEVRDRSFERAILALQGPSAGLILRELTDLDLDRIAYYHFERGTVAGRPAIVSRTGYTGEYGFELYLDVEDAPAIWQELLRVGAPHGLIPTGLGARDSLRLEMGYALYGEDIDPSRTPLEAGLGWVTRLETDFVGAAALRALKSAGIGVRLAGFRLLERGFPRAGYELVHEGEPVGRVTSGIVSPTLGCGIGLAYLPAALGTPGTRLDLAIRGKLIPAEVVRLPFHTGGSLRR